ncbi:MAG TPA: hypothetical protein VFQ88_15205 [Nevskiaceae bacterium]|nr:hypothetical protein [Nevskiaceae bacterium]
MSSTITSGRRAGVAIAKNDKRYYVLIEKSAESNFGSRTPHECCIAVLPPRAAIANAIRWSAAIPCGCLRGRGRLSVSGYIKSWLRALAHPKPVDEVEKTVQVGTGLYHIDPDLVTDAASRLRAIGYDSSATELEHGGLTLSPNDDALAISAVGEPPGIAPWKFINPEDVSGEPMDDEGVHLPPIGRETPVPTLYAADTGITVYGRHPVVMAYAPATPYMLEFHATGERHVVIESWLCHLAKSIEALPPDMPERTAGRFMAAMLKAAYSAEMIVSSNLATLSCDVNVSLDCTPHSDFEAQHMRDDLASLQRRLDPTATSPGTIAMTLDHYRTRMGNEAGKWANRLTLRVPNELVAA